MKNKLLTTLVAILVLFSVANFVQGYQNSQKTDDLKTEISQVSKQPTQVVQGTQGSQGIQGDVGNTGAPGINAISFVTTTIKEIPTIQQITNTIVAPKIVQQFDPVTGDFEQKSEGDQFWSVVIPCDKFVNGCPTTQAGTVANQSPGDLDSF